MPRRGEPVPRVLGVGVFLNQHGLPFPLIPDTDKRLSKLYGARGILGLTTPPASRT